MYLPEHFCQSDEAALVALMREHPLATLVHVDGEGAPVADLVPLQWDAGSRTLRGHVARANPLWQRASAAGAAPVLAHFCGPQAYISPNWYASKAEHHRVVPTWNYTVVQARGPLRAVEDAPWLRALVGLLTGVHEAAQPAPWAVDDAPPAFVESMLSAIVGIEIEVRSLVGKWKVSQNRSSADRDGVARGLAGHPMGPLVGG